MQTRHLLHECQTQPAAFQPVLAGERVKTFKNTRHGIVWYPASAVAYGKPDLGWRLLGSQLKRPALRGKIDGIIQQIAQRLFKQLGVALHLQRSGLAGQDDIFRRDNGGA